MNPHLPDNGIERSGSPEPGKKIVPGISTFSVGPAVCGVTLAVENSRDGRKAFCQLILLASEYGGEFRCEKNLVFDPWQEIHFFLKVCVRNFSGLTDK